MAVKKATPENSKYNRKKYVKNGAGELAIKKARELFAKHKDKPTTAAADPKLRLPEALRQVDPKFISQVLPNMYKQLMSVRNLMNSFNSQGSNSSAPEGYNKQAIIDVFSGALTILIKEYGYSKVLFVLFKCLSNDQYKGLITEYQPIVFEAIINIIKLARELGEENIPIPEIPIIIEGTKIPSPLLDSYDDVPDFYVQQYYTEELDPYPGYVEFQDENNNSVYILRTSSHLPYTSAEEEIFTQAEYDLAQELSPYFKNENLTVQILNTLLVKYCAQIMDDNFDKNNGKNSKDNMLSMLSMFAGLAGTMAKSTQSDHLPPSVLDKDKMKKVLDEHIQNIGKIKKLKAQSKSAFDPMQLLNNDLMSNMTSMFKGKSGADSSQTSSIANTIYNGIT